MHSRLAPILPLTFPRTLRLTEGAQFQAVFDHPRWRVADRRFLLLARDNQLDHGRLGLVIGRRRARHAVDRAAIKRRAREQFRLRQRELTGLDVIVLLRGPCAPGEGRETTASLARLLDKLLAKREQD